ncbi:unnamed protein product [marine sediment metagenome]|uniref:Uncharacterized protein n=1 Tax=marine sediment metagenome TaxID=412755 RepID=X1HDJ5_9ZZZZ
MPNDKKSRSTNVQELEKKRMEIMQATQKAAQETQKTIQGWQKTLETIAPQITDAIRNYRADTHSQVIENKKIEQHSFTITLTAVMIIFGTVAILTAVAIVPSSGFIFLAGAITGYLFKSFTKL